MRTWPGAWWTLHVARHPVAERGSITFGATTIPYSIRRSRRRKKTIEITLDPSEGVLVSAPIKATCAEVARVVHRRAGWIVRKGTETILHARRKQFLSGESVPYLGRQVRIFIKPSLAKHSTVRFRHWSFDVSVPAGLEGEERREAIRRAFVRWYRRRAQERLESAVSRWSKAIGSGPRALLTRDQRQRWGSCAPDGTVRFNWRIVMAEPSLIDYVVAHELLHLRIRTHSRDYWDELGRVMPDYRVRRARLKETGASLSL